jgi:glutamyl-tRNA synthetase
MSVRVRFAPSPTGYLHVGGLRTALYNYLYARHHGGVFLLRIEDTDQTRYVEGSVEAIVSALDWAGITPDESPARPGDVGPYVQSERTELYREYAAKLLASGHAYYAFDTAEELDRMRERQKNAGIAPRYDRSVMRNSFTLGPEETERLLAEGAPAVVRMKVPISGEVKFHDEIRGTIVVPCKDVDDQILLKSDNFPTYHLANVVDDHTMNITHVIRGEEWLPSTPKHVLLYQSFGWEPPKFAHLPLLLNTDKSKLSKRQGDVAVHDYIAKGYFKEAFLNFIALLGWNPSGEREIYTLDELVREFKLENVNKSGAVFDLQKLEWMNAQYLKWFVENDPSRLVATMQEHLRERGLEWTDAYVQRVLFLIRERIHNINDAVAFALYMFAERMVDDEFHAKTWTEQSAGLLADIADLCEVIPEEEFLHTRIHEAVQEFLKARSLKFKDVANLLRLALTGISVGAGMMDTMEVLGKARSVERLRSMITYTPSATTGE